MAVLSASLFTGAPEVVASLISLPCLSKVQKGHALHWQRAQCAFALSAMQNFAHDAVFRSPGKVDEHGWPRIDGGAGAPPLGGCSFFAFGAGFGGAGSATFRQLEHARHLQYAQPASPRRAEVAAVGGAAVAGEARRAGRALRRRRAERARAALAARAVVLRLGLLAEAAAAST